MLLRLSRFVHLLPLGDNRVLVVDAISHVRLAVNEEAAKIIRDFETPRQVPPPEAGSLLAGLMERGVFTEKTPEEERDHVVSLIAPYQGRDPTEMLDRFRRSKREGVEAYFSTSVALTPEDLTGKGQKVELLLFGDCDV